MYIKTSQNQLIAYDTTGPIGGIPSIFIHGGPGSECTESSKIFFDGEIWRCIYFENLKTGWQCEKPDTQDAFEDYEFKDYNQSQLINFAFGDNVLQDLDHDIVKVMKGQKL